MHPGGDTSKPASDFAASSCVSRTCGKHCEIETILTMPRTGVLPGFVRLGSQLAIQSSHCENETQRIVRDHERDLHLHRTQEGLESAAVRFERGSGCLGLFFSRGWNTVTSFCEVKHVSDVSTHFRRNIWRNSESNSCLRSHGDPVPRCVMFYYSLALRAVVVTTKPLGHRTANSQECHFGWSPDSCFSFRSTGLWGLILQRQLYFCPT